MLAFWSSCNSFCKGQSAFWHSVLQYLATLHCNIMLTESETNPSLERSYHWAMRCRNILLLKFYVYSTIKCLHFNTSLHSCSLTVHVDEQCWPSGHHVTACAKASLPFGTQHCSIWPLCTWYIFSMSCS